MTTEQTKCNRCYGCGQIANSDDGEPWSTWEELPPGADLAVKMGLVKPIPCPTCQGTGMNMRRFVMYRRNVPDETHDENQKNPPDEPQFEGVVFSDGKVALRWLTKKRSVAIWDSFEDAMEIHGHPEYGSELVWLDEPLPPSVPPLRPSWFTR